MAQAARTARQRSEPPRRDARPAQVINLDWQVSPQQLEFIESQARHLAYGGARGGGKSWAVRAKATVYCLQYPGFRALILRRTYPELEENHIKPLQELLDGIAIYKDGKKEFRFPNGSIIKLGYCDCDKDCRRYRGQQYDAIFIDESTYFLEDWLVQLQACIRGANTFPKQCIYTTNPGGESHTYHKRIFIDRKFKPNEKPEEFKFIAAKVTDNRALLDQNPAYLETLMALPPKLRDAWLFGRWDCLEGQYFEQFRDNPEGYATRQWTHVIPAEGFVLPKSWRIYRSMDWGFRRPYSVAWYAVDHEETVYRIVELYGVKKQFGESVPNEGLKEPPNVVFEKVARMEREHPLLRGRKIEYGVADPAIWDVQTGISIAEMAAKYGLSFIPGDHKRINGWLQCQYRLQWSEDGYPRFYCLDSCPDFIRTVQEMIFDEHNPEDLDSSKEDHAVDDWRYFLQSRPIAPLAKAAEYNPMFGADPLNQYTRRR